MKYYLIHEGYFIENKVDDWSDLSDDQIKESMRQEYTLVYDSAEDFQSAFNSEVFSTATYQLYIV